MNLTNTTVSYNNLASEVNWSTLQQKKPNALGILKKYKQTQHSQGQVYIHCRYLVSN